MTAISISITRSEEEIVSGIPRFVTLEVNLYGVILYTLDGSDPNEFSLMYVGPIEIPTDRPSVTLKYLATDGVVSSGIREEVYTSNIINNTRLPHSGVDVPPGFHLPSLYPYGTNPSQPEGHYISPGNVGITVDNPSLNQISTGFNFDGYPTGFTNNPYNLQNYSIIYSATNALGETGPNIGNLPSQSVIEPTIPPPETTEEYTANYDPRAGVIYQDVGKQTLSDTPQINRNYFTLENPEKVRDGNTFYTTGLDAPSTTGSFVRSHYNPRDDTVTYYYFDSTVNRWIISKVPNQQIPKGFDGNLSGQTVAGRGNGARYVQEWRPFQRRFLF